jgi:hypothetical protein
MKRFGKILDLNHKAQTSLSSVVRLCREQPTSIVENVRNVTAGFFLAAVLVEAQGGFNGPGRYEIANLKSSKVLDLDRNDQTTVIQFSPRSTDNQRWDIEPADGGFWFIRNSMNGKALQPARNSNGAELVCARFDRSPDQQWRIQPGKDGNALIISRGGRTMDVPDGSSRDGLHLQIYDLNGDSNQRFLLRRVAGGSDRDRPDRGRTDDRDHGRGPDETGRYWDDREQAWKLEGDGVCFYRERGFRGDAFCTRIGVEIGEVIPQFRGSFGSARLFGRAQVVEVYEERNFRGERFRITRDTRDLDRMGSRIGSFRVN